MCGLTINTVWWSKIQNLLQLFNVVIFTIIISCIIAPPPPTDHPEVAAAIKEAAKEAGSSSADEYTVKFNVDILAPIVKHADSQVHVYKRVCNDVLS